MESTETRLGLQTKPPTPEIVMNDPGAEQNIYIVDDNEQVRDALHLLTESVGLNASCFSSAAEFFDAYDGAPGVILLDVRMPGMSGLEMHQALQAREFKNVSVVFMSGHGDIPMAVDALKNGATDFITKPFREQELLDCIHRALAHNHDALEVSRCEDIIERRIKSLTPREREVMTMIAQGQPNKVVALDLNISQRTVEIHRSRVMKKMGSRSLAHLVRSLDQVNYFRMLAIA